MLGWRMEEEAKLEFIITVNWRREDGSIATTHLGTVDRDGCRSAKDVGLQLADVKPILGRLQEIVVSEQLQRYCEAVRPCPRCHHRRHLKDYRRRRYDTVFGRLVLGAPRFDGCRHCGERRITSPVSELLPEQVSPELLHLQVKLAAQLPYRQAAALLDELLPETGSLNHATTRNRTLVQHALAHPEANSERFEGIEAKRDELRSYFMCKKQQMGRSRARAQDLLHVKTAIINGRLDRYTGHHSAPADIAARRISPPDPQVFAGLNLHQSPKRHPEL
jgi:hypothetical protein